MPSVDPVTKAPSLVFDPSDPEVMANPYPIYARLRDEDPVHWSPVLKSWVITRYEDVRDLLLSDALSIDRLSPFYRSLPAEEAALLREIVHYLSLWLAFLDPPDHTRLRRILRHAFTPAAIDAMRPRIAEITDTLFDRLEAQGEPRVDLIREFALRLPAYVIMGMLGIPREMLEAIKSWSDDMQVFIGGARNVGDKYIRAERGCRLMAGYFRELIAERRRNPRRDLLTDLIEARDEGDQLSEDELIASAILMLFAGHETTTNLIGNATLLLLRHPAERARLKANPELIESAIEEVLRFDGPTNTLVRVVARDIDLHGKTLKAGERVFLAVASANRDPRAFADPDRFDVTRSPNRHLTFGLGIHICLGARLARAEGQIAILKLFERFPDLTLDPSAEPIEWIDAMVMRGTRRLPVILWGAS